MQPCRRGPPCHGQVDKQRPKHDRADRRHGLERVSPQTSHDRCPQQIMTAVILRIVAVVSDLGHSEIDRRGKFGWRLF